MKKDKWIHMPHSGHFIASSQCQFHLNTYVGKFIVSTVGEYWPDQECRRIHAQICNPTWLQKNKHKKGDDFNHAYMKEFGYEEIGAGRKYETMVFKAKRDKENICCPQRIDVSQEVDFSPANDAGEATKNHNKMCSKWSKL